MKARLKLLIISISFTFFSCSTENKETSAENNGNDEAIKALVTDYATSINNADTVLAARVWENSDDVSFINPRGHERSWDSIKKKFYVNTMSSYFYNRRLSVQDVTIHARDNTAWVTFYWSFKAKFRHDSTDFSSYGRESHTYSKEKNVWKLVHAHYSNMPATEPGKKM